MDPTILLVDDSRVARLKIEQVLRRYGICSSFLHAENGATGLRVLGEEGPDLVLCDIEMPGSDGFEFLRQKGAESRIAEIPVIMLTGREAVDVKVRCLEAGAADYLVKPFHEQELVARVKVHLQLKVLRDDLRRKNEALELLARVDALTAVANRLHLGECLRREFSRERRQGAPFGLAIVDVDHFKQVNDKFGHQVGDQVLREVARRLRRGVREHDLVARYGGEEFALLLLQSSPEQATAVAERCRRSVSQSPVEVGQEGLRITLSAGVSYHPGSGAESEDELMRQADRALYRAKRQGRDRTEVWAPSRVQSDS